MSSLAELVADLPPRVHRGTGTTREAREDIVAEPYSDEVHEQWLRDLDAEAASRSLILPSERPARRLTGADLQQSILADLIHEMTRVTWDGSGTRGPAPINNEGVLTTLRSYLDAKEPCDRFDALIRHAATTLLLAEAVAEDRA